MKRIILIGTRNGKRAIRWPGLLVTFAAYMVAFTLGRECADWVWHKIVRENYFADWGRNIEWGFVTSVVVLGINIWLAGRGPVEYLPALDRRS